MKTISAPQREKRKLFAKAQESYRKDVERAFRVLQVRFAIVRRPTWFFFLETLQDIMKACIILQHDHWRWVRWKCSWLWLGTTWWNSSDTSVTWVDKWIYCIHPKVTNAFETKKFILNSNPTSLIIYDKDKAICRNLNVWHYVCDFLL